MNSIPGQNPETTKIQKAARELIAAQLTVVSLGADGLLTVQMGTRGAYPDSGGFVFPLTITVPQPSDALESAIAAASCEKLFKRLRDGWSDCTPTKTIQFYAGIRLSTSNAYVHLISSLTAVAATCSETRLAHVAFGEEMVVAPSLGYILAEGQRGELTLLTDSELHGIAVVLDVMSDTRSSLTQGYDLREHDDRTNNRRDQFNRKSSSREMVQWALDGGWQHVATDSDGEDFIRDGATAHLSHNATAFLVQSPTSSQPMRILRPFDLYLETSPGPGQTAEDLATWLVDEGHVTPRTELFTARGSIPQVRRNQPTQVVIAQFVDALKGAVLNADGEMPLAFAAQTNGIVEGVISVNPAGQTKRWTERNGAGLLVAAAQLVRIRESRTGTVTEFEHSIPPTIVEATLEALQSPGTLPPVEFVATEPILTPGGRIARHAGYNRSAKAVITLLHRDRTRWARDYNVPDNPTLGEAQAASELLNTEVLSSFPFINDVDKARGFAYLLTCVGRPLLNGSIGFLATAPDRGSGKTYLLMIGRLLAQGHAGATAYQVGGWADEETRKALVALLLSGGRFFHCDEVPRGAGVKGSTLTLALTAVDGENKFRILQGNDSAVQKGLIITAAGNQVELGGDTNRRFLTIRMQRPPGGTASDSSAYRHPNLYAYVLKNRPQLLAAVHTILLFGLQNKDTQRIIPGMKFSHNWPDQILGAMSHLRHTDGRDLAEVALSGWDFEVAEQDDLGADWGELLAHAWKHAGGKASTAMDLFLLSKAGTEAEQPLLPSDLAFVGGTPTQIAVKWGNELKKVLNTSIPFAGTTYRLTLANKSEKSKKSQKYVLGAYDAIGQALIAGRGLPPEDFDVLATDYNELWTY